MSSATTVSGMTMPPLRARPLNRSGVIPAPILAVLVLVATEIMFFTALVSAHMVIKAGSPSWSPPGDVLLPVATTAFNTGVLVLSGLVMILASWRLQKTQTWKSARLLAIWAFVLGAFFVGFQGFEWSRLVAYGLTMRSGVFGAIFYLLIGSHGLHVIGALLAMSGVLVQMQRGRLSASGFHAMTLFWVFVVAIWPVIYRLVYLS